MNPPGLSGQRAYRPTSLDFINRPNPVEPHAGPEKHPLHGATRLEPTKEEFIRLLLSESNASASNERPAKKQKSNDATKLDLPRLPAVKNGTKRLRIPPTLSGLHQPPPNAGLLPSISEDQLVRLPDRSAGGAEGPNVKEGSATTAHDTGTVDDESVEHTAPETSAAPGKPKRNKWTDEETSFLLQGVKRFGVGSWTRIVNCPDYKFNGRTAIDLKDRFRVCCPPRNSVAQRPRDGTTTKDEGRRKGRPEFKKASVKVEELGMNESFQRSQRRPRTAWSEAEDAALLQGFKRHGKMWSSIKEDTSLDLGSRKPTDLRDRFRTRYPEDYRSAGLTPRPEVFPKKAERNKAAPSEADSEKTEQNSASQSEATWPPPKSAELSQREKENKDPICDPNPRSKPAPATTLFQYDDVFFGAPFADEDEYFTRPTLDRAILDESFEHPRPSASAGIASIETHDTVASASSRNLGTHSGGSNATHGLVSATGGTLPSVAAITSIVDDFADQLVLPGLIGAFGSLDDDPKGGGHLPGLEDLFFGLV